MPWRLVAPIIHSSWRPLFVTNNALSRYTTKKALSRYTTSAAQNTQSYTELGEAFELLCMQLLRSHRIYLEHVGGRGDGGVDMRGLWRFPKDNDSVSVIVQCKNIGKKCAPNIVRELEGVLSGLLLQRTVGFLACSTPATESTQTRIESSKLAIAYLHIEDAALRHVLLSEGFRNTLPDLIVSTRYGLDPNTMKRTESPLFVYKGTVCTE